MDNRPGRSPSPGHPLRQGYQLEDPNSPYGRQPTVPNLEIPMGPRVHTPSDRLQAQPTVSTHGLWSRVNLQMGCY